jgi:hypothetical protein
MSNELPPFYVGQEVVCIKDHSKGTVKKGQCYTILSIEKGCCTWIVDVGVPNIDKSPNCLCTYCGTRLMGVNKYTLKTSSDLFAPKDQFKAITFTKVMETELVSQN